MPIFVGARSRPRTGPEDSLSHLTGQRHFGLAVLALATVFMGRTVANAKTASLNANQAIYGQTHTKWRCPANQLCPQRIAS